MKHKYLASTQRKVYGGLYRLRLSILILAVLLCFSTGRLRAQQAVCDYPVSYNTDQQPTYSGLTGWLAEIFNSFFGARGSINNRQYGYDDEANLLDPQTFVEFQSPAASWSGGAFDPVTQIISSIRYSYRVGLNGSAPGDAYVVISSEGNLFNANILQTIELRAKNNGTVVFTQTFNQLGQWLIEFGGVGSKKAYKIPVPGNFNELEIASIAGFGPNVQSLVGAAAPFMRLYDIRRIPKQPAIPSVSVTNGTVSACANPDAQTTFSIDNPQSNLIYNWYTSANGGSSVFTGIVYKPAATTTGVTTYFVEAVVKGECKEPVKRISVSRASVTRTVTACDLNADADGDGIKNGDEGYDPSNPRDTDGDGKPDYLDLDSDNDGIPDSVEKGATSTPVDTDGDSIPDYRDLDSDNDGINDVREGGGTSTDTNNDGRADGAIDPNTGIPASAGTNGTTTPRDTDGDGKPDYRDLDSDNDGKSDLQENGNPAAMAGDADNDGVIDYSPANDPDKDGIMTPADGIPNTWGDSNDPAPKNTGPNTTDAPDYMNPKSDGTNNDINSTPYKNQDGNGDGKIDNTTDPDNDGIPNVIDTKPGDFGGLPAFDPNGDADGDGIKNGDEGGPNTDTDGDGKPDYLDLDSDNDGIPDSVEKGATSTPVDTDGDSIPDYRDLDSDNDGINDVREGGGTSTDTNNDGRADGAIDPNTGIPASAGTNGTTTPRDTDGDGKPDYRDLDSDNDGKSDLQENGNPAAMAGDADNDGVIDYSPANDPDKDGIMTPADGIPNTWGDSNDPAPKNTGPNTTDAPDYMNPKSDGTANDISGTPNSGEDGNGDGKIDNPAEADNDGIADVIDTKPGEFGGIGLVTPATPDMRPQINMTDVGFSSSATTKPLTVRIRNLRSGTTTTGPVTVRIYKPTPSSVITLTGASATAWTISSTPGYYLLTTSSPIAGLTNRDITANLTINPVTAGNFGLRVLIPNLAGGEALSDNGNNEASITVYGN